MSFNLVTIFQPKGDQPQAIKKLTEGVLKGKSHQTLLGVTGSGKTFSIAHVVANVNKPTLIIAPNKTLAAQLYQEFKLLFPENAVEYFVSYYDYYQPEAYLPAQDLYIEKDASINDAIDRLRHSATHSLLTRKDVIIVASVSCIYGLGSPEAYEGMLVRIERGKIAERNEILKKLVEIQYERNDYDFHRGTFRVRGEAIEIYPAYEDSKAIRLEFFGDELAKISQVDPLTGDKLGDMNQVAIYPNSHYVAPEGKLEAAIAAIREELQERIKYFNKHNGLLEAQRIESRTNYDLEMIEEMGYCKGIENYSRHLTGRNEGEPPPTLLEYYPRDFLCIIDESHISVPQLNGMYNGDRSRKGILVEYGFRLPSALDNRPLRFDEFERLANQVIYVSATPAEYEIKRSKGRVIEQVVRPTGLIDPVVEVRPVKSQIPDLISQVKERIGRGERTLVTVLTKRMAEDLAGYLNKEGIKARYMHADIDTLERVALLRDLRMGKFDVLVGINLLREGLDLPEVSLVAILDADKEGFLRSSRSLIQTFGRASRNINGTAILYADMMTDSMRHAISETDRRRKIQEEYNKKHGIVPETIKKEITDILSSIYEKDYVAAPEVIPGWEEVPVQDVPKTVARFKKEMLRAAKELDFERAAELRDKIKRIEEGALKF